MYKKKKKKKKYPKKYYQPKCIFEGPQNLDFFRYAKQKKTCGLKYTPLSKFLHRINYFSLYTEKILKNIPSPTAFFRGQKICK